MCVCVCAFARVFCWKSEGRVRICLSRSKECVTYVGVYVCASQRGCA